MLGRSPLSTRPWWASAASNTIHNVGWLRSVVVLGGLLAAVNLFTITSFYDQQTDRNKFASWQSPGFAGFNNQMLMLATAPLYQPIPARSMVAPDMKFQPIHGFAEERWIPAEDIFEEDSLRKFYVESPKDVAPTIEDSLSKAQQLAADAQYLIFGSVRSEDYWQYIYPRFIVFGVLLRSPSISHIMQSLSYKDPVRSLVNAALSNRTRLSVQDAIGVHIRTFDYTAANIGGDVCTAQPWYNPLQYYYKCAAQAADLAPYIDLYDPSRPIYLAVDNPASGIVADLQERYGDRVFFLQDALDRDGFANNTSQIPTETLPSMVENELLRHTHAFIGNFWSTYSAVVAVKRGFMRTHFVRFSFLNWLRSGIWIMLSIAIMVFIWRSTYQSTRAEKSSHQD